MKMSSYISNFFSTTRVQLIATAAVSGATVASLILGYQALQREERLSQLKNSIPPITEDGHHAQKVNFLTFRFCKTTAYKMHS
jgi:PII-like signaling protein